MRSFIAINFEDRIKNDMNRYMNRWRKQSTGVKWVGPHGMHLTLKFLGDIETDKLSAIRNAVKTVAAHFAPFPVSLKGTGSFPPRSRSPRVLWIGMETNPTLSSLHAEMETELEQLDFPREAHPFHPHLTLGRVKKGPLPGKMIEDFHQDRETVFGEMMFRKITIFESVLMKSGAAYSPLAEVDLL